MTESTTTGRWHLPWPAVTVVDLLILLTVGAAIVITLSGGFRGRVGDVPFTARSPERPVGAAVLLLVVRRVFARTAGPFGSPAGTSRRLVRRWVKRDEDESAAGRRPLSRRALGLAAVGYLGVAVLFLHPQLVRMDSVPDLGDPLFSMWRIGWVYLQLQGDPRGLFDANIFHPEPLTLTYSDSMLLTSLLAAPLLVAGVAPAVTYNILMVTSFLLSAAATYLLVMRLTGSPRAAFVAGLLYGFHPFRFEHYSHLELQMTYWMPLALLALHRFVDTGRPREIALAAVCLVGQLYSSMYYAVFFPLYAAAVFGTFVLVSRPPIRRLLVPMLIAGAIAGALAMPIGRAYSDAQPSKGDRALTEVESYSATPSDYLRAHPRSATHAGRVLPPLHGERALFPGVMMIVLALAALVPPFRPVRLAYLAGLLLAFDMSTGLHGVLYEPLYNLLSPIRGMRVPARFSVILGISLAVLAAFGVQRLLSRLRTERARMIVFALIVGAALVDLRPALRLTPVWPHPPSIYTAVAGRNDVVLAEFPFAIDGAIDALPQMYFSTWHGLPIINGYSGFFPASYDPLLETMTQFPDQDTLAMFRARGVTHITVTCALLPEPEHQCDELLQRVESSGSFRRVAASRWEEHPSRLYEMLP